MEAERNQLPPQDPEPTRWPWVVGGILVLLTWWIWSSSNDPVNQEKSRKRATIDLCWEEQARKSLDPAQQRFIAGACERMEAEFTQKYGVKP